MNNTHTQLKALVLLFILVLGVTVSERAETIAAYLDSEQHTASIFNPVAAFLGISDEEEEVTTNSYDSLQVSDTQLNTTTGGLFTTTPTPTNTVTGVSTNTGDNSPSTDVTTGSIKGLNPALYCLPNIVAEDEEALIMWACRDGAHTAEGTGFETNGDTYGAVRVTLSEDTTYEVDCFNDIEDVSDTRSTCSIDVAKPALAFVADASSVSRGGTVTLSWNTKDTARCTVTSDAHSLFKRSGIEGEARTPAIVRTTTFTLRCETRTGVIEERDVTITL